MTLDVVMRNPSKRSGSSTTVLRMWQKWRDLNKSPWRDDRERGLRALSTYGTLLAACAASLGLIFTAVGLFFSVQALRASRDANDRASESFDASIRPLITSLDRPLSDDGPIEDANCLAQPDHVCLSHRSFPTVWVLSIPIQNVGLGVARITGLSRGRKGNRQPGKITAGGLPSGATTRMEFGFLEKDVWQSCCEVVTMHYADITGKHKYTTRFAFNASERRIVDVEYLPR
jgi:hypothetical protein